MTDNPNVPVHIEILRREFRDRVSRQKRYSLRAFARDLDLSPAFLSLVLNMKKGISETRAEELAKRLNIPRREAKLFVLSVLSAHARDLAKKNDSREKLKKAVRGRDQIAHLDEKIQGVSNWVPFAILELAELPGCEHTPAWFARRLGLTEASAHTALERLIADGMLRREGGRYVAASAETISTFDISSEEIRRYHAEILLLSERALRHEPVSKREFLSMVVAFPEKRMAEAKDFIRDFQEKFAEKFYSDADVKDSVYHLGVQLFRVDKRENA